VSADLPAHAIGFAPRARVGLLGGSFNPAHEGHLEIALIALRRLALDEVWFLVSPGNPLKSGDGMAPLAARAGSARRIAGPHPRLRVVTVEAMLGTRYTADTLTALTRRFRRVRFTWLMGADNLAQIPAWARWRAIFAAVPVAVFARPGYSVAALAGRAARRFAKARKSGHDLRALPAVAPPAWGFFHTRLNPASASAIRDARARRAGSHVAPSDQLSSR
jgi:nicotinate-nucleotide adenylyltransferase